jgi:hypothetical protein
VIAATSQEALAIAVQLGVGGALRLPPSTLEAGAALEAAARVGEAWVADAGLADLAADWDQDMLVAGWINRQFWRCQLGEPEMTEWLAELARELEVLPAIVPWPALVLADRTEQEVQAAWDRVAAGRRLTSEGIAVVKCRPKVGHCGVAAMAVQCLLEQDLNGMAAGDTGTAPQPVFEIPRGNPVGFWAPSAGTFEHGDGWLATPESANAVGFSWCLEDADGQRAAVHDVVDTGEIVSPAVRLPGWAGRDVGPGRPAGVLVEVLANASAREGIPLWVPNVSKEALGLLLRLPGVFWVDGPAAPSPESC